MKGSGLQKLWHKLKNVKTALKTLHMREFAGIDEKIRKWEKVLDMVQKNLQANPTNEELHKQERDATI